MGKETSFSHFWNYHHLPTGINIVEKHQVGILRPSKPSKRGGFVLKDAILAKSDKGGVRDKKTQNFQITIIFMSQKFAVQFSHVQNPYDIPLYYVFNRDPYNGLL